MLLDGQDIKRVTQESLRRVVAVVPQDTVMFNDTGRQGEGDREGYKSATQGQGNGAGDELERLN